MANDAKSDSKIGSKKLRSWWKSHEARKKSKQLLEEAKRKVEEMIDSTSSLQVEKGNQ